MRCAQTKTTGARRAERIRAAGGTRGTAAKKAAGHGLASGTCSAAAAGSSAPACADVDKLDKGEGAISLDPPRLCRLAGGVRGGGGGGSHALLVLPSPPRQLHPHQPNILRAVVRRRVPVQQIPHRLVEETRLSAPLPLLGLDLEDGEAGVLREVDDAREAACEIDVLSVDVRLKSDVLLARWANHPLRRVPSAPSTPRRLGVRGRVRSPLLPCPCDDEDEDGGVDAEKCRSERVRRRAVPENALGGYPRRSRRCSCGPRMRRRWWTQTRAGGRRRRFGAVTLGGGVEEAGQLGDGTSCRREYDTKERKKEHSGIALFTPVMDEARMRAEGVSKERQSEYSVNDYLSNAETTVTRRDSAYPKLYGKGYGTYGRQPARARMREDGFDAATTTSNIFLLFPPISSLPHPGPSCQGHLRMSSSIVPECLPILYPPEILPHQKHIARTQVPWQACDHRVFAKCQAPVCQPTLINGIFELPAHSNLRGHDMSTVHGSIHYLNDLVITMSLVLLHVCLLFYRLKPPSLPEAAYIGSAGRPMSLCLGGGVSLDDLLH
ncbi:hypothetical protein B0H19DRAFT_1236991 [Mycena capillaripes]|nr:hypothetical protein B0H19DRAFT_1236991 [Mycena capillaripes]